MKLFLSLCTLLTLSFIFFSCIEDEPKTEPIVSLAAPSNITSNTATVSGSVTADGGASIIEKGVCWSTTNKTPTTSDSKYSGGPGTGSFSSSITGLTPGTTYNLRAYATNSVGTGYSDALSFTTLALLPTLTTNNATLITANSFSSGGNITSDGGSPVTARGVCWGTATGPTITNSKTSDGTGTGTFTRAISGLTAGTTYYVRSYATNSIGTSYGAQVTVATTPAAVGQFNAYVFVESNELAPRTALANYMTSKGIPNSIFKSFHLPPTSPSQVQTTFDAQMNAYLSYPGWGSSQPSIFSAPISNTSGGLDKYGIYISAYQFQTIEVPGNTLPTGVLGQFLLLVPVDALNGKRYSTVFIGASASTDDVVQSLPYNDPIANLTIRYTGSVNIPKGDYKIYFSSMSGPYRRTPNGAAVYLRGGTLIQ